MFITVSPRTSDAIAALQVNPVEGVALVEFENGYAYEYTKLDYDPFAPRVKAKTNSEFQYREKLETKKMRVEKLLKEKAHG